MFKSFLKCALAGGVILFVWGTISWTLLPWHTKTLNTFADQDAVAQALAANATRRGIYIYPNVEQKPGMTPEQSKAAEAAVTERMKKGPIVFVSFEPQGVDSMAGQLGAYFVIQFLAAGIVGALLMRMQGLSYWGKVVCSVLFGAAAALVGPMVDWNWWKFGTDFSVVVVLDLMVSWFLAGLAIARFAR